MKRLKEFKPYKVQAPLTLDVSFKNYRPSEVLAYLKGVERPDSHSIRYQANSILEISDFMLVITSYTIGLEP